MAHVVDKEVKERALPPIPTAEWDNLSAAETDAEGRALLFGSGRGGGI